MLIDLNVLSLTFWLKDNGLHRMCFSHPPAKKVREGMYCDSLGTYGSAQAVPGPATHRDRARGAHPVTGCVGDSA